MPSFDEINDAAIAAGFELTKRLNRYSGYLLVGKDGEKPLGADYTASLADVARYLKSHAEDLGDVEEEPGARIKPIPNTEIDRADRMLAEPSELRKKRLENQKLIDYYDGTSAWNTWSADEREHHVANRNRALAREEEFKAALMPKSATPLRTIALNSDHPLMQELARQGRVFQRAEQQLRHTNIRSILDHDEDEDGPDSFAVSDYKEAVAIIQQPLDDAPAYRAVDSRRGFEVTLLSSKRQAEISVGERDAAVAKIKGDKIAQLTAKICNAIEVGDVKAAGAHLQQAKRLLGHGNFLPLLGELGISPRRAQRLMGTAAA